MINFLWIISCQYETNSNITILNCLFCTSVNNTRFIGIIYLYEVIYFRLIQMGKSKSRSQTQGPVKEEKLEYEHNGKHGFKSSQLTLLNQKFQQKQTLSSAEVTQLARATKLSEKQVRGWFANKRKRYNKHKSTAFSKVPKVNVLMDMDTINALKKSIVGTEYILVDEESNTGSTSLSESTSVQDRHVQKMNHIPLTKPCNKTNKLIENLLQKIEELEEGLKEKEGDLYLLNKDLDRSKGDLQANERVLKTIQQSIPKVVSDHKKELESKDLKILELQTKVKSSEETSIALTKELDILKKEMASSDTKNDSLRKKHSEYEKSVTKSRRILEEKELEQNIVRVVLQEKSQNENLKLLKAKESQCRTLEVNLKETRRLLTECRDDNRELHRKELRSEEKISMLEFEIHSKSAELVTMGEVIKRLNEKIQTFSQNPELNIKTLKENSNLNQGPVTSCKKRMKTDDEDRVDVVRSVISELISNVI